MHRRCVELLASTLLRSPPEATSPAVSPEPAVPNVVQRIDFGDGSHEEYRDDGVNDAAQRLAILCLPRVTAPLPLARGPHG